MPLDPSYVDAIRQSEGFSPQAQWDYKQNSNGYGTRAQYPGEVIDKDTAEQRYQAELAKAEAHVESVAPNAPPGVKAALTSLTYNAGPGWSQSGLGDLVRAGDWTGAAQRFQEYNKAGGQVNPGLVNRRTKEAAWFKQPPAGESAPPQMASAPPMQIAPMGGAPAPVQSQPNLPPIYYARTQQPAQPQQSAGPPLDLASFRQAAYGGPPTMPAYGWSPGPGMAPQQMAQQAMPQAPPIQYYRPQMQAFQTPLRRGLSLKG